jgi:hypothetical protein
MGRIGFAVNQEFHLLDFWPEPGPYTLRRECVGKNRRSDGHFLEKEPPFLAFFAFLALGALFAFFAFLALGAFFALARAKVRCLAAGL